MAIRMGFKGKLFYGTAGTQAGTELTGAQDVKITLDGENAPSRSRASGIWKPVKRTGLTMKIDFSMVNKSTDTGLSALLAAAITEDALVAIWARDASDGKGPDGDFVITKCERDESMGVVQGYSFTLELNDDNRAPTWS